MIYFKNIINVQQYLINESIALYKKILPFIQYFIAYETIFRLKSKAYKFLEINSYKRYCKIIENLLKQIDDKYILEQKIFPSKLLIFALSKLAGKLYKFKHKSSSPEQIILILLCLQHALINDGFVEPINNPITLGPNLQVISGKIISEGKFLILLSNVGKENIS